MTQDALQAQKGADFAIDFVAAITKTPVTASSSLKWGELDQPAAVMEKMLAQSLAYKNLLGKDGSQRALVHQWVSYAYTTIIPAGSDLGAQKSYSKFLNDQLVEKTFFAGLEYSWADMVIYAHTHAYMSKMTPKRRLELNHFTRWFDLIQHHVLSRQFSGFPLIEFDLEIPEVVQQQQQPVEKQVKGQAKGEKDGNSKKSPNKKEGGDGKKDKKKDAKPKKEQPPAAAELPAWNPVRLDIRVGKIVECKQHENADSLYVEQIDLGEDKPRTVVSGLVKHVPLDQMLNRMVVVLCNLKPASMRGIKSEGMVLAATGVDGKVELLNPPTGAKPGDRAHFDSFSEGQPDAVLNSKKKVWETIQPNLFTDDARIASYRVVVEGQPERVCQLKTGGQAITVASVTKASIK